MQKKRVYALNQIDEVIEAVRGELGPGTIVALSGLLGAGKTTFVQKLCESLGIAGPVLSPTYSYVQTHKGIGGAVTHFDLYRISGIEEFESLGFEEYLQNGGALTLIEWPDRISSLLERPEYKNRVVECHFKYVAADAKLREIKWILPEREGQGQETIFESE